MRSGYVVFWFVYYDKKICLESKFPEIKFLWKFRNFNL